MPWFAAAAGAIGSAIGGAAGTAGAAAAGTAAGTAAAAGTAGAIGGAAGLGAGAAGTAAGLGAAGTAGTIAGMGAMGGALTPAAVGLGSLGTGAAAAAPAAGMGGALASALTPASVGLGSIGGGSAAGGALSALPTAAPALANTGGGLLNSSILAPQHVASGGTQMAANPVNALSSGQAVHNPFGLSASQAPTWGQRTFGNNMLGQGIDETLAMVDPRASSPQLVDARMGALKNFAKDQFTSGMKDQMNFAPAPAMPNRQVPQQQQGNNVTPYTVNSLNRFNRRLNPFGGGL